MIKETEIEIVGGNINDFGVFKKDKIGERIDFLITHYLSKISSANWTVLYQDPKDKRYWELDYPQGHLHGGGSAALKVLTQQEASDKYKI
jgi:hypothetical protein